MEIKLSKKPKNPIIIEGFPGFGLVGTIATEFLIEHLKCEQIGKYYFDDLPATIAIHDGKVVDPIGIFYNKKYNIAIIHSISAVAGMEWKAADLILNVAKQLAAKEVICLEGVGGLNAGLGEENRVFFNSNNAKIKKDLESTGIKELKEGIIIGVTSALLLKSDFPLTCIFAEAHTNLPDSRASAQIIKVLDKYLSLEVDYKPLLEQAHKFEEKLKGLLEKSQKAMTDQEKKQLSYVG
ncbi:proteasome assembly chaperone family protein [Candidatus Woesearchaeota archaeon]|nr:proteasome assembly chaperone family protein [Candidatus Woesearchaeota archaeon]